MSIPNNITRDHILQAIRRVDLEGVPPRREARRWAVKNNRKIYPCKLLISWANVYPNGEELNPNPNIFTTFHAQDYLHALRFEIVEV